MYRSYSDAKFHEIFSRWKIRWKFQRKFHVLTPCVEVSECCFNSVHAKMTVYFWKTMHVGPGPSRGGKGEVFPGPATFGVPRRRSKILKMVFQMAYFWPKICTKSIFDRWGAYDAPRTPSRMVRGHLTPRFLPLDAFGVSISRHTEWG